MGVRSGGCAPILAALLVVRAQADEPPDAAAPLLRDAGATRRETTPTKPKKTRPFAVAEMLHATSDVGRMHVRCHSVSLDDAAHDAEAEPMDKLHCAFFSTSVRQRPPERLATRENFSEILRDLAAQCRTARTRTDQARKQCAACRPALSEDCLYLQVMKDMQKRCDAPAPAPHDNPVVRALEADFDAHPESAAAIQERFCAACRDEPTFACYVRFWLGIEAPRRCALVTAAFEVAMTRQVPAMTWVGNLGDPCGTQVALNLDESRRTWTYRQVQLTPDRCPASTQASVYSSAAKYALPELPVGCDRMAFP
ncbi:MAG: hypothetical protein ABW252_18585 [Polyangiales bacterium]